MMSANKIYIKTTAQVSAQQPLTEDWFTLPSVLEDDFVPASDPQFKEFISPMAARRMTPVLKRALVTSKVAMSHLKEGTCVDAILTGTGLGSTTSSEKIIQAMIDEGETLSMPTQFMQSTHNTIGSLVAIDSKCHAYNATYSQDGISAECALLDAFVQMRLGRISNALVGAHDELPRSWHEVMKRGGIMGNTGQVPASEASVAMLLSNEREGAKCEVLGIELAFNTSFHSLLQTFKSHFDMPQVDALMMGVNGWEQHDEDYLEFKNAMPGVQTLHYKHITGETCSASAMAIAAATTCLERGYAPPSLRCDNIDSDVPVKCILLAGSSGSNKSLILLKSCD